MEIKVAHDVTCGFCWIAIFQIRQLKMEFPDVDFRWVGYEMMPLELEWEKASTPPPAPPANKPKTPTRFEFALEASGVEWPQVQRPRLMRTNNIVHAFEFAYDAGVGNEFIERVYEAYYREGQEVNQVEVIVALAEGLIEDIEGLKAAIEENRYADRVVKFDDEAYSKGIYNLPTFFIGDQRLAEQPTSVLRKAIIEARNLQPA
ncbi:MAG: DsbA family protein [Armatimonadetes bacterium]|nr:DsbA family protein [Armatimonadota bacterium]